MATTPTNLPVPSESPIDLKFNAGKIDEFVTSMGWTYTDRFGQKHYTIEGINYLAQQAMAAFGYVILTGKTFTTGATINNPNEVLLNTADGEYYKWTGSFASGHKEVPANSTPSSTGGVGPGAWLGVGDSSLRAALASVNGADLIGYKNPQSQISETLNVALDKINVRLIYASDFGVKTDSSDNADALWNLGQFISNATEPLYVIFPHGTSLVGSQEFAGATGKGYSYRPSYFSRPWGDPSDRGWFSVHRTDNDITLDMTGWTLKMNDGMKHGSFDPVTGAVYNPPSLPFTNYDYQAGHGFIFKSYKTPNLKIIGGEINGNIPGVVWGGKFGDDGYQVFSYNSWFNESEGVYAKWFKSTSSPNDGIYINENANTSAITDDIFNKRSVFEDCEVTDCGRNNISYASGNGTQFIRLNSWRSGGNANGIGSHASLPQSCFDVESEAGAISNLTIKDSRLMHGGKKAIDVTVSVGDINNVLITDSILHCEIGDYALYNTSRNFRMRNTVVYGGASLASGALQDPAKIEKCKFYNRINNRYISNFSISGKAKVFDDNEIYFEINPNATVSTVVLSITPFDLASGGYGNKASCKNLYINISGNSDKFTIDQIGAVQFYRGCTIHVDANLTGKNLILYMTNSTSDYLGLSTNSPKFNFGGAMGQVSGLSVYYDMFNSSSAGGPLIPSIDSAQPLGKRGMEFKELYSNGGVYMRSPQGDLYLVRVANNGTLTPVLIT